MSKCAAFFHLRAIPRLFNPRQAGLAFNPAWTKATVVVSEVTTRIPAWAMHGYAGTLIQSLKPTRSARLILQHISIVINRMPRVALLDSYPAPAYITAEPILYDAAPVRYLSTCTATPTSALVRIIPLFCLISLDKRFRRHQRCKPSHRQT